MLNNIISSTSLFIVHILGGEENSKILKKKYFFLKIARIERGPKPRSFRVSPES